MRIREVKEIYSPNKNHLKRRRIKGIGTVNLKGGNLMERALRKKRIGRVVSDKMDKTIVVAVETKVRHPLYGKTS